MKTTYQLGPLSFSLDGEHPVRALLDREFSSLPISEDSPRVHFRFVPSILVPEETTRLSGIEFFDGGMRSRVGALDYRLHREGARLDISLASTPWRGLSENVSRFFDWNYLTPDERRAKNFIYDLFDFTSQIGLLEAGASYLHASSFERDGRGVALVAWGGIGKTTTMLKLVLEDGWRFLSDDLGLIDTAGNLHRTPKWMQIYAYNLEGQAAIHDALLSGRTLADRASWALSRSRKGIKGVRRRVSAEQLFGSTRLGEKTPLTDLYFLERASVREIESRPVDPAHLAQRAASILLQELQPFTNISVAMHSSWRTPCLPSVEELRSASEAVFLKAFARLAPVHVLLPQDCGPEHLAVFFRKRLG